MKTSELTGAELDSWVAKAEGYELDAGGYNRTIRENGGAPSEWYPSTDWNQGGPIIEREHITTTAYMEREYCGLAPEMRQPWIANIQWDYPQRCVRVWEAGPTPLIAAMRAYVDSVFGEDVDATLTVRANT